MSEIPSQLVPIIGVAVGNSRTRVALIEGKEVSEGRSFSSGESQEIAGAIRTLLDAADPGTIVVTSSVNDSARSAIEAALGNANVLRIGRDLPIPIQHSLDDATTVGQDRLLCALGAYSRARQACVIVDAGTAITVNFIDGEGTFHGGVIAPGLRAMLHALHTTTSALPAIDYQPPDPARGPFGKDTRHAMLLGVRCAAIGLVRYVVERYAEHYEAYPQIVATGGDAMTLFAEDEVVEHIVPDLQMLGIAEVVHATANAEPDEDDDSF
jgi:type III pantothenate kinase